MNTVMTSQKKVCSPQNEAMVHVKTKSCVENVASDVMRMTLLRSSGESAKNLMATSKTFIKYDTEAFWVDKAKLDLGITLETAKQRYFHALWKQRKVRELEKGIVEILSKLTKATKLSNKEAMAKVSLSKEMIAYARLEMDEVITEVPYTHFLREKFMMRLAYLLRIKTNTSRLYVDSNDGGDEIYIEESPKSKVYLRLKYGKNTSGQFYVMPILSDEPEGYWESPNLKMLTKIGAELDESGYLHQVLKKLYYIEGNLTW